MIARDAQESNTGRVEISIEISKPWIGPASVYITATARTTKR